MAPTVRALVSAIVEVTVLTTAGVEIREETSVRAIVANVVTSAVPTESEEVSVRLTAPNLVSRAVMVRELVALRAAARINSSARTATVNVEVAERAEVAL